MSEASRRERRARLAALLGGRVEGRGGPDRPMPGRSRPLFCLGFNDLAGRLGAAHHVV